MVSLLRKLSLLIHCVKILIPVHELFFLIFIYSAGATGVWFLILMWRGLVEVIYYS